MANTTGTKFGGRKKGTPNKKTTEIEELILSTGCLHPVVGLAQIAMKAETEGDLHLAKDCYKELAQYVAPKKKAIEHTGAVETNQPLIVVLDSSDDD